MTLSNRVRVALLTPLVTLFVGAQIAEANEVCNGSFESGPAPGAYLILPVGSTAIDCWTVVGARIVYVGGYWGAPDGVRSIGLSSSGGIAQTFPTEVGRDYEVRFRMAGDPFGSPAMKGLSVSVGGPTETFTVDMTGNTPADMGWEEKSFVFTATDTTTTLTFVSITAGAYGAAIDHVRVTPFPLDSVPTVELTLTGCTDCQAGEQFTVQAHWTNVGSTNVPTEVKIGFRLPDGTPVNIVGNIHLVFAFPAGLDVTADLISFAWPSGQPAGTWTFEATLLGPSLGETSSRSVESFTVTP